MLSGKLLEALHASKAMFLFHVRGKKEKRIEREKEGERELSLRKKKTTFHAWQSLKTDLSSWFSNPVTDLSKRFNKIF